MWRISVLSPCNTVCFFCCYLRYLHMFWHSRFCPPVFLVLSLQVYRGYESLLQYLVDFVINLLSIWLFICTRYRTAFRLFNLEPLAKPLRFWTTTFSPVVIAYYVFPPPTISRKYSCSCVTDRKNTQKVGRTQK
jgi:hypothetical protein